MAGKCNGTVTVEKPNIILISGSDDVITESQIQDLIAIIKSEGVYKEVFYIHRFDPRLFGGPNFELTGVEFVRYIIRFLAKDQNVRGVIIISNGLEAGGIPSPRINGIHPRAHCDMLYGDFGQTAKYNGATGKYDVVGQLKFGAWVSRISTYSQAREGGKSDHEIIDEYIQKRRQYNQNKNVIFWESYDMLEVCRGEFIDNGYNIIIDEKAKTPSGYEEYIKIENRSRELLANNAYSFLVTNGHGSDEGTSLMSWQTVNDTPVGGHGIVMFSGSCDVGLWVQGRNHTLALNLLNSPTLRVPLVMGFSEEGGIDICRKSETIDKGSFTVRYEGLKSFPECLARNRTLGDAYLEWVNTAVYYKQVIESKAGEFPPIEYIMSSINPATWQMFGDGSIPIRY